MRWLIGLAMLVAGPATAQITPSERFQDCVKVRMPAAHYEVWLSSKCHEDRSCQSFEQWQAAVSSDVTCADEGYRLCERKGHTDAEARNECVAEMDSLTEDRVAKFDTVLMERRFDALLSKASGFPKHTLERRKQSLDNLFSSPDCSVNPRRNIFNIPEDAFCERLERISLLVNLQILDASLSRMEQGQ